LKAAVFFTYFRIYAVPVFIFRQTIYADSD